MTLTSHLRTLIGEATDSSPGTDFHQIADLNPENFGKLLTIVIGMYSVALKFSLGAEILVEHVMVDMDAAGVSGDVYDVYGQKNGFPFWKYLDQEVTSIEVSSPDECKIVFGLTGMICFKQRHSKFEAYNISVGELRFTIW